MSCYLLAIDPGLRVAGVALFDLETKTLFRAWACKSPVASPIVGAVAWAAMAEQIHKETAAVTQDWLRGVERLILEEPQVYRGSKQKGDPDDLIQLAGVDGAIVGRFDNGADSRLFASVKPSRWKGTIDSDVMLDRILGKLSADEKAWIVKSTRSRDFNHNAVDAVGLGLWALGRLGSGALPFKESAG